MSISHWNDKGTELLPNRLIYPLYASVSSPAKIVIILTLRVLLQSYHKIIPMKFSTSVTEKTSTSIQECNHTATQSVPLTLLCSVWTICDQKEKRDPRILDERPSLSQSQCSQRAHMPFSPLLHTKTSTFQFNFLLTNLGSIIHSP